MTALRERILPLRTRAVVRNDWLKQRLDTILPALMAREGFDMWIVAAREYNEDPVIMTMLPEPSDGRAPPHDPRLLPPRRMAASSG